MYKIKNKSAESTFENNQSKLPSYTYEKQVNKPIKSYKICSQTPISQSQTSFFRYPSYTQQISGLNYIVTYPSSSLIMSSLSNINQGQTNQLIDTNDSTISHLTIPTKTQRTNQKVHYDFYQYLMNQNQQQKGNPNGNQNQNPNLNNQNQNQNLNQNHNRKHSNSHHYKDNQHQQQQFTLLNPNLAGNNLNQPRQQKKFSQPNYTKTNKNINAHNINAHNINTHNQYVIGLTAQQSLQHLEQSQQELSFLKFKLQQAYEKLQKQIINSYELEQKIQFFKGQIDMKSQLLCLQKEQNEKLKYTLKVIMKNKSLLEQQIEQNQHFKQQKQKYQQKQKQFTLKSQLSSRLKSQQLKKYQLQIQSLKQFNKQSNEQIQKLKKQLQSKDGQAKQKLINQIKRKDIYLDNLTSELQQSKQQVKNLLNKQCQHLNKINILEIQLQKVTDQKVTIASRLRHQISLLQQNNNNLLDQNNEVHHMMSVNTSMYSPSPINKRITSKSCNKTINNQKNRTPTIFNDEQDDIIMNGVNQFDINHLTNIRINDLSHRQSITSDIYNKQNIKNYIQNKQNITNNIYNQQNIEKSNLPQQRVGKWRRQSANQSYQSSTLIQKPLISTQTLIESKITIKKQQNQDQKLSKYQIHRKGLENQLRKLEQLRRPTKEDRQKMDKLEKQLYYVDSDIAGLKRKIRKKY